MHCQPFDRWSPVTPLVKLRESIVGDAGDGAVKMTVALLGEAGRRRQPERTVTMNAPQGVAAALLEQSAVTSFT